MSEFKIDRLKYNWKGIWSTGISYLRDDIVSVGSNIYVCIVQHTATGQFFDDLNAETTEIPPNPAPRWELLAEGKTWLGFWEPNTYYEAGSIARKGAVTYLCVQPHTSSDQESGFFDDYLIDNNWTIYISSQEWRNSWTTQRFYNIGDIVVYSGNVYRCIVAHTSASTLALGLNDDLEKWSLVYFSEIWKGDWQTNTVYIVNDIVKYGGSIYKCINQHVSASTISLGLEDNLSNWTLFHDGVEYLGEFAEEVRYKINDVVKYGSYLYKCIEAHTVTIGSGFDISKWQVYCPGFEYDVLWNSTTVYQPGDIVRYGGYLFVSKTINLNQEPDVESDSDWEILLVNTQIQGEWSQTTSYKAGDLVRRQGQVYVAKRDVLGNDTDLIGDNSTINSEDWELFIPGSKWQGQWTEYRTYVIGDLVLWRSGTYRCVAKHSSIYGNRPNDEGGEFWEKYTYSDDENILTFKGDIKTYGIREDGSTIGTRALSIGSFGQTLQIENSDIEWKNFNFSEKTYYVSPAGTDQKTVGSTLNAPWKTIRYALENITGPATLFVKAGIYEEVLPLRVPAFVAVVGDELRTSIVRPAIDYFGSADISIYTSIIDYINFIIPYIIREEEIGTDNILNPAFGTVRYGTTLQNFAGTAATSAEVTIVQALITQIKSKFTSGTGQSILSTNLITVDTGRLNAAQQIFNNIDFILSEINGYVSANNPNYNKLPSFNADVERILNAVIYDLRYVGNYQSQTIGEYFYNARSGDANKISNMFLLRDATGLRNMTLSGLEGELGSLNEYLTRRPTAGAYASLDPGWGTADESVWVGTRSPYVQNVTTFGTACIGLKVDGDLHDGGNQTIVSNDFTQILSDGIGIWCNGAGKTEAVSVFTYYNHIGYLCTNGGKIRGTNGNCSYGLYGASAEGVDLEEIPITGKVNNRFFDATVAETFASNGKITKLFFSHAGNEYSTVSYSLTGSGMNAQLIGDEFRNAAISEVRIVDPGDSSTSGGSGYVVVRNNAQSGDPTLITIAGSDINTPDSYRGMRIVIDSGTGSGQYGYIAEYDDNTKNVYVANEFTQPKTVSNSDSSLDQLTISSTTGLVVNQPVIFTGTVFGGVSNNTIYYIKTIVSANKIEISDTSSGPVFNLSSASGTMTMHLLGWNHFQPGTTIENVLDTTTSYVIEPRVIFSTPGFSSSDITLPVADEWQSIAFGNGRYVAIAKGQFNNGSTNSAWSEDGSVWNLVTIPTSNEPWIKVAYGNNLFIAVSTTGKMIKSSDGSSWSVVLGAPLVEYSSIVYGNGTWVVIASGGTFAATSSDGEVWTTRTLPEGADWSDIAYGKGKFVVVSQSDSTVTNTAYSIDNGQTWVLGSFAGGCKSITYGNNRFVAIEGNFVGANNVFISFDGINWTTGSIDTNNWQSIKYYQGLFIAVAESVDFLAISVDGLNWSYETLSATESWKDIVGGQNGKFILISATNSTAGNLVVTGATAQARVTIGSGRISSVNIWEPGSGYGSTPIMVLVDPNNTSDVSVNIRLANGVIGNPTILNGGDGWSTTSTTTIITGDGFKDQYQLGRELVVSNLTRIPGPGDNLYIDGINDYTYKVLSVSILSGNTGSYTAKLIITKTLNRDESPDHLTDITIRQLYSQVRLTGHDFLDIGLGNFEQTNYPDTLFPQGTILAPENEVIEAGGGRVFYTSTDQDGNFRCGELFAVEQATGIVTISADFFVLEGLEELQLGGVSVGGSGVVIREFSTDPLFVADSNNIIPTQRAIKSYIARRVSGGGADAFTAVLIAGVVRVGPQQIDTTTGDTIEIPQKVNFLQPVDGSMLIQSYFLSGQGFVAED